jgi:hypothetical protein
MGRNDGDPDLSLLNLHNLRSLRPWFRLQPRVAPLFAPPGPAKCRYLIDRAEPRTSLTDVYRENAYKYVREGLEHLY